MSSARTAPPNLLSDTLKRRLEISLKLRRLDAAGLEDSDAAEALRDEADGLWRTFSDEQKAIARGLSEDLYSFTDPPEPRSPPNRAFLAAERVAAESAARGDWQAVLQHNRLWRKSIVPWELAHRRCWAWRHAGLPQVAMAFADQAARLAPDVPATGWMRLETLTELDSLAPAAELHSILEGERGCSPGEALWHCHAWKGRVELTERLLELLAAATATLLTSSKVSPKLRHEGVDAAIRLSHDVLASAGREADWDDWLAKWWPSPNVAESGAFDANSDRPFSPRRFESYADSLAAA